MGTVRNSDQKNMARELRWPYYGISLLFREPEIGVKPNRANHFMKHYLFIFLALLVALPCQAAWQFPDWRYKQSCYIRGSTSDSVSAQVDYQIDLEVFWGSGTSSGDTIYLNSHAQSDYDDLRFVSATGETLSYYIHDDWVGPADTLFKFVKYDGNPLDFPHGNGDGAVHIRVIYFENGYDGYKYYAAFTPYPPDSVERPWIMRSNNGINFSRGNIPEPVVHTGKIYDADVEIVYVGAYEMWFMSWVSRTGGWATKLGFAYSPNGTTWTAYDGKTVNGNNNPWILSGTDNAGQSWEVGDDDSSKVGYPSLYFDDATDTLYLYYSEWTQGNNRGAVGVARIMWDTSASQIDTVIRYPGNPVFKLPRTSDGILDSGCGHIEVFPRGDSWYMYCARRTVIKSERNGIPSIESGLVSANNRYFASGLVDHGRALPAGDGDDWDAHSTYTVAPLCDSTGAVVIDQYGRAVVYYSAFWADGDSCEIGLAYSDTNWRATITVEMDTVPTGHPSADSIRLDVYYGNDTASSVSSMASTFIQSDDFEDETQATGVWDNVNVGSGNVIDELGDRLWVNVNSTNVAGYVTDNTYAITNQEVSVTLQNAFSEETDLCIMTTHVTSSNPFLEDNGYRMMLYDENGGKLYIQRKLSGVQTTRYSGAWIDNVQTLTIRRVGGMLHFYEGSTLRHSETWPFGTDDIYIYLYTRHDMTDGFEWWDDFTIRKYIYPEPQHGIWLGEQDQNAGFRIIGCNILGCSVR